MILKIEEALFNFNKPWHYLYALVLLPFSALFCAVSIYKKLVSKQKKSSLPIISVGNLSVGGSGKSPFTIELCSMFSTPCVVSRGYGRKSKGLVVVSYNGELMTDTLTGGDEAVMIAASCKNASVVVCEDRREGIKKAVEFGADAVILDDGFGKFSIRKFDILLRANSRYKNPFCLPSGPYRYPVFFERFADLVAVEGVDFCRVVAGVNAESFFVVTAISNPNRLLKYIDIKPEDRYFFADHTFFDAATIQAIVDGNKGKTMVCTKKDGVKLRELGFSFEEIEMKIEFSDNFKNVLIARMADKFSTFGFEISNKLV